MRISVWSLSSKTISLEQIYLWYDNAYYCMYLGPLYILCSIKKCLMLLLFLPPKC